jgi:hypothetical protein
MASPVADFVQVAGNLLVSLAKDFDLQADGVLRQFMAERRAAFCDEQPRSAMLPRGRTPSGVIYALHGIGCRFRIRYRGEVDLDLSPSGAAMFNAWRVRWWAKSIGAPQPDDAAIEREANDLMRRGMLRVAAPGWWTSAGW